MAIPYNSPSDPSGAQSQPAPNNFGSFHGANNFGISHSTFIETYYGGDRSMKLDELKLNLRTSNIKGCTYDELPKERRDEARYLEVPDDIRGVLTNPEALGGHYLFTTSSKNVLSQFGLALLRLFSKEVFPGVRLVAHILFYEIPISEKANIVPTRPNVSRRWVTTLACQLMQSIPELESFILYALLKEPELLQCDPSYQLRRLIVEPLRVAAKDHKLPRDEHLLVLLDCIDCSMDSPQMVSDIASFLEDLQDIEGLKLRILATVLRNTKLLRKLNDTNIVVRELPPLKRVAYQQTRRCIPSPSILVIRLLLDLTFAVALLGGIIIAEDHSGLETSLLYSLMFGMLFEAAVALLFLYHYLVICFYRPWDVHGRKEEVKQAVLKESQITIAIVIIVIGVFGMQLALEEKNKK